MKVHKIDYTMFSSLNTNDFIQKVKSNYEFLKKIESLQKTIEINSSEEELRKFVVSLKELFA